MEEAPKQSVFAKWIPHKNDTAQESDLVIITYEQALKDVKLAANAYKVNKMSLELTIDGEQMGCVGFLSKNRYE